MLCLAIYQMADGTFWTAPKNFYQLFILHAPAHRDYRQALPCVFVLLTGKAESDYNKMLEMVIELATDFNLNFSFKVVISDFEYAIRNAYKRYFTARFMACSFHLKQAMIKLLGKLHLRTHYGVDKTFQQDVHAVFALSFVPSNDIKRYFDDLHPILTQPGKEFADAFKVNLTKIFYYKLLIFYFLEKLHRNSSWMQTTFSTRYMVYISSGRNGNSSHAVPR